MIPEFSISPDAQWYYSNHGEQFGPVSLEELRELFAEGTLTPESYLWTKGLEDWVRPTQVDGLVAAEDTSTPSDSLLEQGTFSFPVSDPPTPIKTALAEELSSNIKESSFESTPQKSSSSGESLSHYPPTSSQKARFGTLLGLLLSGCVLMVAGVWLGGFLVNQALAPTPLEETPSLNSQAALGLAVISLGYLGGGGLLLSGCLLALRYLYRAWSLLQWSTPRTSPGKAVGYLFLPLFNSYWTFVAYRGLAQDWNRTMSSYPDLALAPQMREGLFLAFCVCTASLIGLPIALVIWFFVMADICRGINFMASRATLKAKPGGLTF